MSTYNKRTKVFNLTAKKAHEWYRRKVLPDGCKVRSDAGDMAICAAVLRFYGLKVLLVRSNYLQVHATPGQVWEALSGQPSDPEREKWFL